MRNPGTWHNAAALSRAARRLESAWDEIVGAECREQSRPLADAEVFSLDIPFNRTADQSAGAWIGSCEVLSVPTVCHFVRLGWRRSEQAENLRRGVPSLNR